MSNNLAKPSILLLVFLSILLIFLSLTNVSGKTPQPIYKVGDYFVYKYEFSLDKNRLIGWYCSVEMNVWVEITKIDFPYVYVKMIIKDVKISGGWNLCPSESEISPIEETSFRIDEKPSTESSPLFVDPSYSDTFQDSNTYPDGDYYSKSYKYNKGVLISRSHEGVIKRANVSVKLYLVETSVPGLIIVPGLVSDNIMWIIINVIIIAVLVSIIVVTFYYDEKKKSLGATFSTQ
jgi:hypothetical protein